MSDYAYSVVMICPAADQLDANHLSCAMQYDAWPGNTFSVPLSPTGESPPTHYGCRGDSTQEFVAILADASDGTLPDAPWGLFQLTPELVGGVLGRMIVSVLPTDARSNHFEAVLAENGLQRITVTAL
jgi:hypothetical protein